MQESIRSRIEKTYARISVVLGHAHLTTRELLQMREGDVIPLDVRHTDPLELRVEDLPKFLVRPGRLGKHLAVRVVDTIGEATGDDE
jgi:flagellar motor switch protein FliM